MRIRLVTSGSRGDVEPYVALGLGLKAEGHEVALVTHEHFRPLIEPHGLRLLPIAGDMNESAVVQQALRVFVEETNPWLTFRGTLRLLDLCKPISERLLKDAFAVCQDADLLICGGNIFFIGETIAEAKGIPLVFVSLQPTTPSCHYPNILVPPPPAYLPALVSQGANWISHRLMLQLYWQLMHSTNSQLRAEVAGLPPLPRWPSVRERFHEGPLIINAFAPELLDPPDWGRRNPVTGFLTQASRPGWEPPSDLVRFLAAGPPPILVGFGSMVDYGAAQLTEVVLEAVRLAEQRAVIVTGWGAFAELSAGNEVYAIPELPYDWLLPQMSAAVFHGGAGTLAATLRAGIPSVIVPFMSDQLFWARRVHELGLGTSPLPRRELTAPKLAERIRLAVFDASMRERARTVASRVRQTDGVGNAIAAIHDYLDLSSGR